MVVTAHLIFHITSRHVDMYLRHDDNAFMWLCHTDSARGLSRTCDSPLHIKQSLQNEKITHLIIPVSVKILLLIFVRHSNACSSAYTYTVNGLAEIMNFVCEYTHAGR